MLKQHQEVVPVNILDSEAATLKAKQDSSTKKDYSIKFSDLSKKQVKKLVGGRKAWSEARTKAGAKKNNNADKKSFMDRVGDKKFSQLNDNQKERVGNRKNFSQTKTQRRS